MASWTGFWRVSSRVSRRSKGACAHPGIGHRSHVSGPNCFGNSGFLDLISGSRGSAVWRGFTRCPVSVKFTQNVDQAGPARSQAACTGLARM
eukprot:3912209-Rhodomonas_salina.1